MNHCKYLRVNKKKLTLNKNFIVSKQSEIGNIFTQGKNTIGSERELGSFGFHDLFFYREE